MPLLVLARFLSRFRRDNPGKALRQIGLNNERDRRRAVVDQMRADLRANGRTDMQPVNWPTISKGD